MHRVHEARPQDARGRARFSSPTVRGGHPASHEWAQHVHRELQALPANELAAIRLGFGQGLTQDEVATRLGVTAREVCMLISDGLRRLASSSPS